jgi:hypothetical protein
MVNRLIICHFPTAAYLYRFRRREDPSCPECGEEETVDHLLLDCDATADLRDEYGVGSVKDSFECHPYLEEVAARRLECKDG